jgi:single-strand DNA-binding protein
MRTGVHEMSDLKMPDINNILIAGNITSEPTFRKTSNGTPVTNFYIVSNRKFRDNNGQWRENLCYVGVVAWYKLAEVCYESLQRGSAVLIDGELQSRPWRNEDGSSRNVIEVKARRIQFLDRKSSVDAEELTASTLDVTDSKMTIDAESKEEQTPEESHRERGDETIPPTDYDFGYQDLEL